MACHDRWEDRNGEGADVIEDGLSSTFVEYSISEGNGFTPPAPEVKFLFRLVAEVATPIEVGKVNHGFLKVIPITGGIFEGPSIRGEVLPLGADWNTSFHNSPTTKGIDTRYILKTDDGHLVSVFTKGYQRQSETVLKRRADREPVDPSEYYFKQHLFFETSSERYSWLNNAVAFACVISRKTPGVIYDAWIVT